MALQFELIESKDTIRNFVSNYLEANPENIIELYGEKVAQYTGGVSGGKFKSVTFPMDSFPDGWRVNIIDLLFPVGTKKPSHDKDRFKIHLGIDDSGNRVDILSYANKGRDENAIFYKITNHKIDYDFLIDKEYAWICDPNCFYVTDL